MLPPIMKLSFASGRCRLILLKKSVSEVAAFR